MTTTVHITGAGQAGATAALALARASSEYDVTVYERRGEADLRSYGVLGITPQNTEALRDLGADLSLVELDNHYSEWNGGNVVTSRWGGSYVMWTDLHQVLMAAAKNAGVRFVFSSGDPGRADVNIQATGVTTAARELHWDYAGYMVYRGLSALDTSWAWLAYDDPAKRFAFKLAHSPLGASWEMYAHRPLPTDLRSQTAGLPGDLPWEADELPAEFRPVVAATRELQIAPISDWEQRSMLLGGRDYSIGDANGAMRPHTGMGANLGIREALALPALLAADLGSRRDQAAKLLQDRNFQHDRGIRMGRALLGS